MKNQKKKKIKNKFLKNTLVFIATLSHHWHIRKWKGSSLVQKKNDLVWEHKLISLPCYFKICLVSDEL